MQTTSRILDCHKDCRKIYRTPRRSHKLSKVQAIKVGIRFLRKREEKQVHKVITLESSVMASVREKYKKMPSTANWSGRTGRKGLNFIKRNSSMIVLGREIVCHAIRLRIGFQKLFNKVFEGITSFSEWNAIPVIILALAKRASNEMNFLLNFKEKTNLGG